MPEFAHLDSAAADRRACVCGSGLRALRCCACPPGALPLPSSWPALDAQLAGLPEPQANPELHPALPLVLDLAPNHPAALRALYAFRATHGPATAADALLARFVGHHPNDVWGRCELSLRALRNGDMGVAEREARSAIRLAPLSPLAQEVAGVVLIEQSRGHAAEHHFRRSIALSGERNPILLARLATSLRQQSRLDESRTLYAEANEAKPGDWEILYGWSQTEQAARRFADAQRLLDAALAANPGQTAGTVAKAELRARFGNAPDALSLLDSIPEQTPESLLARGRILDRAGEHTAAFASWREGRALALARGARTYPADEVADTFSRLRNFFTRTRLATLPRAARAPGPQPIFILGFPRSGTTLVEQMLSAHSMIHGGDELPLVHSLAHQTPHLLNSPLSYPEALSELWMGDGQEGLETLRDQYLRGARHLRASDPDKPWFTDKMPLNETHLGLIHLMFPESPTIRLVRHPCDILVSVFSNLLTHGYHCASELHTAALHLARVTELAAAYRAETDVRCLELRYEALVDDPAPALRMLLGFIGVPFEQQCLRVEENTRFARTASHAQVTEPVYARSRYRWRRYRAELAPVLPILEPAAAALGYDLA